MRCIHCVVHFGVRMKRGSRRERIMAGRENHNYGERGALKSKLGGVSVMKASTVKEIRGGISSQRSPGCLSCEGEFLKRV